MIGEATPAEYTDTAEAQTSKMPLHEPGCFLCGLMLSSCFVYDHEVRKGVY